MEKNLRRYLRVSVILCLMLVFPLSVMAGSDLPNGKPFQELKSQIQSQIQGE